MRYFIIIFLGVTSNLCSAQTIVIRKALAGDIKVPIPFNWQKVEDEVSKSIRTNRGTYNIISFYKGEISENLVSLYGDSIISKIVLANADLQRIKAGFEKKTLPELAKISMADVPTEKVLLILKKFYKDDPKKLEILETNKEAMLSKGKVTTETPMLTSLQSNGFYYLLPVSISVDNIFYSFSLISGYIRLNKYSYGISGSVEKANKGDFDQFIKNLLIRNPS